MNWGFNQTYKNQTLGLYLISRDTAQPDLLHGQYATGIRHLRLAASPRRLGLIPGVALAGAAWERDNVGISEVTLELFTSLVDTMLAN